MVCIASIIFRCCMQKLLRIKVLLVDILVPQSIVVVEVLIMLSTTKLYDAKRVLLLLGMSTLDSETKSPLLSEYLKLIL